MRKITEKDIQSVIGVNVAGITIDQARIKSGELSDSDHYGIALGKSGNGYATWEFKIDEKDEVNFYWGHYFNGNEAGAIKDYNKR